MTPQYFYLGPNMKLQCLVCFLAILPQFSNGKNYYLVNDEKSASEYVYGLFGLTNVVGKWILDLRFSCRTFRLFFPKIMRSFLNPIILFITFQQPILNSEDINFFQNIYLCYESEVFN